MRFIQNHETAVEKKYNPMAVLKETFQLFRGLR
jgi:hypothetical protein